MKLRQFYTAPAYVGVAIILMFGEHSIFVALGIYACLLFADVASYFGGMQAGEEIFGGRP